MRRPGLVLILSLLTCMALAQKNGSIRGLAFDTLGKQPVSGATITVLDKKDSSLVSFTMSDHTGQFELKGIPIGDYRLLITHTAYHNSHKFFSITEETKTVDLGNLVLNDKSKVLQEVVVTNEAPPVTLINDTIQYNAGSFKTQPNASVEQLLKKLPGVKVEKDGTIKAQGETVNRVLVDGKEFFGNDPKLATKNLPADAIDKVQVYDRQSEQGQLTGFDDGNYEKTINLKLKKDKKKGVFGKINASGGSNDRYQGKFNVNSFKGARQISAIGMGNNTNVEGFTFRDILNFSGALAGMQKSGGNISINITPEEAAAYGMGGQNNSGINTIWGGGINFNNIIGNKIDFQSNYFYNRYNPQRESQIERQYFLPDSFYYYKQHAISNNLSNNHRFSLNILYEIDSMNTLRLTPSFSYQEVRNQSNSNYQTLSAEKILSNEGFSNSSSNNEGYNFRNELIYRRKFNRKGRTFSVSLQTNLNESEGDGSNYSITHFYAGSNPFRRDTINQVNITNASLKGYTARGVYTEPLGKGSLMELTLMKSNTTNLSGKLTYDFNRLNGMHDRLNQLLSNDFENAYGFNSAGLRVRTQQKKYNYSIGFSWQQANLEGKIVNDTKDSVINKRFNNLLPNARFQYNFSKFKNITINYTTSTNQPAVSQLQPVPDNSNPLNIRLGNPDLKQEYSHNIQAGLHLLSPYKNKNLFGFFRAQAVQNKIVNYDTVDQFGIRRTKPVNVNGVYTLNGNLSYSMPFRFLKGSVEISSNTAYSRSKQFINEIPNSIITITLGPELRLDMNPHDKLNLAMQASLNYNKSMYSLQADLNSAYLTQEYGGGLDWEMSGKFFFSTDFSYNIYTQRSGGFNTKTPLWNASLSRNILRFNRGEIKLSAMDLLNKNVGISRSSNQNYIEDSRVNSLKRFFLLSFTYSLSKTGISDEGPGGMRVITR